MRWSASGGAVGAVLGIMLLFAGAAPAATPEFFQFPTGYLISNFGVTTDGTGNVWFSAQAPQGVNPQPVASLARVVPGEVSAGTSNGITFYPTPNPPMPNCCATQVRNVSYSAQDDRLYWVRSDGVIGTGIPGSMVAGTTTGMQFTALPGNQDLWDVAAAPSGGAWFTEHSASSSAPNFYGDRVGFYDGGVTEGPNIAIQGGNTALNPQRFSAQPAGIAVDPKSGRPWFVEENAGSPGYRIATYNGGDSYAEYLATPCAPSGQCSGVASGSGLRDIAIAKDGTIWFTNTLKQTFGRFDPETLSVTQYALGTIDSALVGAQPWTITSAPDGTIWMGVYDGFTNANGNAIVKIVPSAAPTAEVFKLPGDAPPLGIGADNAGNIWFGLGNPSPPSRIGRLTGVVSTAPAPPAATAPTPTPASPAAVPLKPVTIGTTKLTPPQVGNGAINTNQICVGPPEARCSLVYLINEHEYVAGFPGAGGASVSAKHKKKKPKPRVIGRRVVTLRGGQSAKVTVKLNALGRRILKGKKKLKVDFTATQTLAGGKTKLVSKKTLTMRSK